MDVDTAPEPPENDSNVIVHGTCGVRAARGHTYVESHLDPEEVATLCEKFGIDEETLQVFWAGFREIDEDGSGQLEHEELKMLCKLLDDDMTDIEFTRLMRQLDGNSSSAIGFEEFLQLFSSGAKQLKASVTFKVGRMLSHAKETHRVKVGYDDLKSRVLKEGIQEKYVVSFLEEELKEADACEQLPFCVALFVVWTIALLLHERNTYLYLIDMSLSSDIVENANFAWSGILPFENGRMGHKKIYDVNNIPDFWSWLSMGLVPLLFVEAWDLSEVSMNILARCVNVSETLNGYITGWRNRTGKYTGPPAFTPGVIPNDTLPQGGPFFSNFSCPDPPLQPLMPEFFGSQLEGRGMHLYYNRVVGGIRMRQEQDDPVTRPGDEDVVSAAFGANCYRPTIWLLPDIHRGLAFDEFFEPRSGPSARRVFEVGTSQSDIRAELVRLEDEKWFSPSTRRIEIIIPTYNAVVGVCTVSFINFYISRSGHFHKHIEPVSVWLHPYHDWSNYVFDILWVLFTFKMLYNESLDVFSNVRQHGCVNGIKAYLTFWNFMDWLTVGYSILMTTCWFTYLHLVSMVEESLKSGDPTVRGYFPNHDDIDVFFARIVRMMFANITLRKLIAVYPFFLSIRFFQAFAAQPRLSVVTKALSKSFVDLVHFGIVFLAVLFTFIISGMILFGEELEDFATIDRAMNTCWRLLLGDFDWEEIREVGRTPAGLWFWSMNLFLFFVMLNMLMAVILDKYTEVKVMMKDSETIFSQSREILKRLNLVRNGKMVTLHRVLNALGSPESAQAEEHGGKEVPNMEMREFMERVPGLPHEQAVEIMLAAAHLREDQDKTQEINLTSSILRLEEMLQDEKRMTASTRELVRWATLIIGAFDNIVHAEEPKTGIGSKEERFITDLERAVQMLPPEAVTSAVEGALASRLGPALAALERARADVTIRTEELRRSMEQNFDVTERYVDRLAQRIDLMRCGSAAVGVPGEPLRRRAAAWQGAIAAQEAPPRARSRWAATTARIPPQPT